MYPLFYNSSNSSHYYLVHSEPLSDVGCLYLREGGGPHVRVRAGVGGGAACPPLISPVPVGVSTEAAVVVRAPGLPPHPVGGLSVEVAVRVHHRQNVPAQRIQ